MASAYEMRGQCLLQLGQYEDAVADLTLSIDASETLRPRTHYLRAIAKMQLGANEEAIEDLDVCVAFLEEEEARVAEDAQYESVVDADVVYSRYYRGIAHMQVGNQEAAIQDFESCIDSGINAETARFWRGACYLDVGEYTLALDDFTFCQEAGIDLKKGFPHNLRHLFACTFYEKERDISHLADILGHKSINTTRIYTLTNGEIYRSQIESLNLFIPETEKVELEKEKQHNDILCCKNESKDLTNFLKSRNDGRIQTLFRN